MNSLCNLPDVLVIPDIKETVFGEWRVLCVLLPLENLLWTKLEDFLQLFQKGTSRTFPKRNLKEMDEDFSEECDRGSPCCELSVFSHRGQDS
jgi:hypothetical protein